MQTKAQIEAFENVETQDGPIFTNNVMWMLKFMIEKDGKLRLSSANRFDLDYRGTADVITKTLSHINKEHNKENRIVMFVPDLLRANAIENAINLMNLANKYNK